MSENNSGIMTIADFKIESMTADALSALDIHNNIINAEQTAAAAMMSLCENLKKMRDTQLYKSLGFEKFEDYTEQACNIKKRQAYNYIQTYEKLGSSFLQSNAQLGITKLQLLTEVCAVDRAEFVEENDLEGMSVADVRKLIDEHRQTGEQLSLLENEVTDTKQELCEKDKLIAELEAENKELRNRPVEVAVQEPSAEDIEKAVEERTAELKRKFEAEKKQLEADSKAKVKEAKEKATAKAEKERQKAIDEAKAAAKQEVEEKYKEELESARAEKAEALKRAEAIASKLDKNADQDLVKASLYFDEAKKQLEAFKVSADKISETDPEKGAKLKKIASDFLKQIIDTLA